MSSASVETSRRDHISRLFRNSLFACHSWSRYGLSRKSTGTFGVLLDQRAISLLSELPRSHTLHLPSKALHLHSNRQDLPRIRNRRWGRLPLLLIQELLHD